MLFSQTREVSGSRPGEGEGTDSQAQAHQDARQGQPIGQQEVVEVDGRTGLLADSMTSLAERIGVDQMVVS